MKTLTFITLIQIVFGLQDISIPNIIDKVLKIEDIQNVVIILVDRDANHNSKLFFPMPLPYVVFRKGNAETFNINILEVLQRNLFFIVCCDIREFKLLKIDKILRKLHSSKGLYIDDRNTTNITFTFERSWINGYMNVLLWTKSSSNNLYRYEQFPEFKVFPIDDINTTFYNSKTQLKDLNGYKIRTPLSREPPRAFLYVDPKTNETKIGGYAGKILINFLRLVNGTLSRLIPLNAINDYNMKEYLKLLKRNKVDILIHPYLYKKDLFLSFPIKTLRWEIIVPVDGELEPYKYFLMPFDTSVWLCILGTIIYISLINTFMHFLAEGSIKLLESFSEMLLRFLSMSSEESLQNISIIFLVFEFQVLLISFIINNLYLSHLTTFLTTDSSLEVIDKLEELVDRNIKVLAITYELANLLVGGYPKGFEELIVGISADELNKARNPLKNTSFAYFLTEDKRFYFFKQQEKLKRPNFHVMKQFITIVQLGLLMPLDSPFVNPLDDYLVRIQQAGLVSKWDEMAVQEGKITGDLVIMDNKDGVFNPLNLTNLQFAWMCVVMGNILACVIFSIMWLMKFTGLLPENTYFIYFDYVD